MNIRDTAMKACVDAGLKHWRHDSPYAFPEWPPDTLGALMTERGVMDSATAVFITGNSVELWSHPYPLLHSRPRRLRGARYESIEQMVALATHMCGSELAACWKEAGK